MYVLFNFAFRVCLFILFLAEWRLLHCQLLRRIIKTFRADKWMQELLKLSARYGLVDECDEGGYANLPVHTKLLILKLLCELQFDRNVKFKERIDSVEDASAIRQNPNGRDKYGNSYYYFQDSECNVYLYKSPESSLDQFEIVAK